MKLIEPGCENGPTVVDQFVGPPDIDLVCVPLGDWMRTFTELTPAGALTVATIVPLRCPHDPA